MFFHTKRLVNNYSTASKWKDIVQLGISNSMGVCGETDIMIFLVNLKIKLFLTLLQPEDSSGICVSISHAWFGLSHNISWTDKLGSRQHTCTRPTTMYKHHGDTHRQTDRKIAKQHPDRLTHRDR